MDLSVITREAVLDAIAECDQVGRERFLERYGFEEARRYFLRYGGVYYDSKAIVGVAYRHVAGRPLSAGEFSGGQQTVGRLLARLGFEVVSDEPPAPEQRLLELLGSLRVAITAEGPARHQPITLLWALGRAAQRRPRLVSWRSARRELRGLMREYGQPSSRATPEFPVLALARTDLWELRGHVGDVPAAHGNPVAWLDEQDPSCGLAAWVYELDASVRMEAVGFLGSRFFGGGLPEGLLEEVGLGQGCADESPFQGADSRDAYRRLCGTIEAAEARGDHDRASTRAAREQPVRSSAAVRAVLMRSGGRCENPLCAGQPEDVKENGDPILEVDHVLDRARWGRDHPIQMIALCPNCHAIKTWGRTGERLREVLLFEARVRHSAWCSEA
ncbi:HNH endonuclease signature motif containing protein [Actinomadura sp. NEAU-AAG7]|uniref:HNH endonuclease signature motif containing protein n=1 Tax=Actinomadura sp. NEAU-AAG7 TaxID=2839640 RepID=UPI001BE4224E|nr:HNH endonuclease signature motif containing protein [Actinomadura sp. NEAU-AAG7]MBT2206858.1 HNH endonuclease [Actinomadura sp. NEAU-AAG7]